MICSFINSRKPNKYSSCTFKRAPTRRDQSHGTPTRTDELSNYYGLRYTRQKLILPFVRFSGLHASNVLFLV
ncbi:hypothetical protein KP509_28G029000 [Ceratopteris richardii]|uniref:Uncharacterized protein n=1 Tax=Ceratopteris richardii TaxID=49495 RepID=A0A8T2RDC1_CERRI|nr:hypothetical protein KP509_28G029000 [Ceratopteris richardii]